jgi:hypothetical protein
VAVDENAVRFERWTCRPDSGGAATAVAVRDFAAAHGMGLERQGRLELAVAEALGDAVSGDSDEPVMLVRVDAALDPEWMTVRIEHAGFAASGGTLARLSELVERVESCGPRDRAQARIQFECEMRPQVGG